ncbi:hypothetical protein BC937DRAFT_86322 [Endogone sp. FLAS-F59071]|nr:hypothetical protein BC937DRAFT_86322 [Endogone sp. FLAS-F59071]|eukprot:RUS20119.1 hypothetical protein BC937DRAFT_86322 [Endogone sp. FLAS-F59071]
MVCTQICTTDQTIGEWTLAISSHHKLRGRTAKKLKSDYKGVGKAKFEGEELKANSAQSIFSFKTPLRQTCSTAAGDTAEGKELELAFDTWPGRWSGGQGFVVLLKRKPIIYMVGQVNDIADLD